MRAIHFNAGMILVLFWLVAPSGSAARPRDESAAPGRAAPFAVLFEEGRTWTYAVHGVEAVRPDDDMIHCEVEAVRKIGRTMASRVRCKTSLDKMEHPHLMKGDKIFLHNRKGLWVSTADWAQVSRKNLRRLTSVRPHVPGRPVPRLSSGQGEAFYKRRLKVGNAIVTSWCHKQTDQAAIGAIMIFEECYAPTLGVVRITSRGVRPLEQVLIRTGRDR